MKLFKLFNLFTLVFIIGCTLSYAAEEQKVAARVNGVPITEEELEKATDAYIKKVTYHGDLKEEKREEYKKTVLDRLIEKELFYQEAKARGMTVKEGDIDEIIKEVENKFKDKKDFDRALKALKMTLTGYREMLTRNELIKKIERVEIEEKCRYSDKELEDYYNANKEKFVRPESFRIRHILIAVTSTATDEETKVIKDKAMDVLKRAKAGEAWAELAYNYSNDPYRVKGGDLGWVHKGRLEPEIEDVAFKLKVGEISEIIETTDGYHIVKLEDKRQTEQSSFADVKDSLKKKLEAKRYKEVREAFIDGLKAKAVIKIY